MQPIYSVRVIFPQLSHDTAHGNHLASLSKGNAIIVLLLQYIPILKLFLSYVL